MLELFILPFPNPTQGGPLELMRWQAAPQVGMGTLVAAHALARDQLAVEIEEIATLEQDWDGYGGAGISVAVARNARNVAWHLRSLPDLVVVPGVTPTSSGTIAFTWEMGDLDAHFEVGMTRFSGFVKAGGQSPLLLEGAVEDINTKTFWPIVHAFNSLTAPTGASVFASENRSYSAGIGLPLAA